MGNEFSKDEYSIMIPGASPSPNLMKDIPPPSPNAPPPPAGWDKKTPPSYQLAREARK